MQKTPSPQPAKKSGSAQRPHTTQRQTPEQHHTIADDLLTPGVSAYGNSRAAHPAYLNLLALQRAVGNRAVGRLIQAELTISRPHDPDERAAAQLLGDEKAEAVASPPVLKRVPVADEEAVQTQRWHVQRTPLQRTGPQMPPPRVTPSLAANIHALNGSGSRLPDTPRAFFEPRFGADFSQVRVHTDSRAVETASSIQARTFTVGPNIAFGVDQYSPESRQGRQLLAHELTHVVPQNGSQVQRAKPLATGQAPQVTPLLGPYTAAQPSNGKELSHRLRYTPGKQWVV